MRIQLLHFLLIILISVACKSRDDVTPDVPNATAKECYITEISATTDKYDTWTKVTYGADRRILYIDQGFSDEDERDSYREIYVYDGGGKLVRTNYSENGIQGEGYEAFKYNSSDYVSKYTSYKANGEISNFYAYEYNTSGMVSKIGFHYSPNSTSPEKLMHEYTYSYNNSNQLIQRKQVFYSTTGYPPSQAIIDYQYNDDFLTKTVTTYSNGMRKVTEFEYEDKKLPFSSIAKKNPVVFDIPFPYYLPNTKGILKRRTTTDENNKTVVDDFRYEYNEHGYPVKEYGVDEEGRVMTTVYKYECE